MSDLYTSVALLRARRENIHVIRAEVLRWLADFIVTTPGTSYHREAIAFCKRYMTATLMLRNGGAS